MDKEYIIEVENHYGVKSFITGGTYKFGGERYACVSEIISNAKRYSSKGRAINAGNKLAASCKNIKWISILRTLTKASEFC